MPTCNQGLEATNRLRNLYRLHINSAQFHRLVVRESVHGFETDVEPGSRMVHCQHIDALRDPSGIRVGQLPARPALGRIPAGDGGGSTDEGEIGQRAKCRVTESLEAMGTVGASLLDSAMSYVNLRIGFGDTYDDV
jgi:hypothetical protein